MNNTGLTITFSKKASEKILDSAQYSILTSLKENGFTSKTKVGNPIEIKAINRKSFSININDDTVELKINGDAITDFVTCGLKIFNKFVPFISMVKSVIPMIRNYAYDVRDTCKAAMNKWKDEREYALFNVKTNYCDSDGCLVTCERIKGENTWRNIGMRYRLVVSNEDYETREAYRTVLNDTVMTKINSGKIKPIKIAETIKSLETNEDKEDA